MYIGISSKIWQLHNGGCERAGVHPGPEIDRVIFTASTSSIALGRAGASNGPPTIRGINEKNKKKQKKNTEKKNERSLYQSSAVSVSILSDGDPRITRRFLAVD